MNTARTSYLFISIFFFSAERISLRGLSQNCGAPEGTPRMSTIAPRWSALQLRGHEAGVLFPVAGAAADGKMLGSGSRSLSSSALAAHLLISGVNSLS